MNGRGVAALVRGWVDLYTRGLPPAVRAARREEVDDDLWCQHDEAIAIGRSGRSLSSEILLRFLLGMPADLSWRASQSGGPARTPHEESPSMAARVVGLLAIIGGASWGTLIIVTILPTAGAHLIGTSTTDAVLILAGGAGLTGAMIGPAWLFQDQIRTRAGLAAAIGALATVLEVVGAYGAFLVVPIASTVLVWELAHIGVLARALAVIHGLSAAAFMALIVSFLGNYAATQSNHLLMTLGVPYLLTWIVMGALFIRGVPAAHVSARGG
jgi:hypothetical protein